MKRYSYILIALASALFVSLSCSQEAVLEHLTLSSEDITILEGADSVLAVTLEPEGIDLPVEWKSMNESIATVDANGRVHGILGGRTFILASAGSLKKGCAVTVVAKMESISIDKKSLFVPLGSVGELNVSFYPERALNRRLVWTSSDPSVATVSNGVVVAVGIGNTRITAVSEDNPEAEDYCDVEVGIAVESVVLSTESAVVYENETVKIDGSVLPSDASHHELIWTSSDPLIASVDADGLVTGVSVGTATITATAINGEAFATASVEVRAHVSGVTLSEHNIELYSLETKQLTANVIPEKAYDKSVVWSSGNPVIVTVDEAGRVTGRSKGSAVITVTTVDGSFTDQCTVSVISGTAAVAEIKFEKELYVLAVGKKLEIIPIVLPLDAEDKSVTWISSDPTVASVGTDGFITGVKTGIVTLTATSKSNPAVSAACKLQVVPFDLGPGGGYDDKDYKWED